MVKDSNRPKGRTSAYAFFVLSCRDELKRKSPTTPVNFAEFSKNCLEQWKAMAASEKTKFEDMAKDDDARYNEEMRNYVPPKGIGKKGRRRKDPLAPKRPSSDFSTFCSVLRPRVKDPNRPKGRTSAYAFFVLSCRDELVKTTQSAPGNYSIFIRNCSDQWTALAASERKKFEDMAKADEARYNEEMKNYAPPKDLEEREACLPKQPTSAFFIFCSELMHTVRSEHPSLSTSEVARKLVEMWSKLDSEGRAVFEQKSVQLRGTPEEGGPGLAAGSTAKVQGEPEDDEEEEDEEDDLEDEAEDDMEDLEEEDDDVEEEEFELEEDDLEDEEEGEPGEEESRGREIKEDEAAQGHRDFALVSCSVGSSSQKDGQQVRAELVTVCGRSYEHSGYVENYVEKEDTSMVKDANRPKGRTSAYAFFVLSCRDELKKKSPTTPVNFGKFSKNCSEQWKALTATDKKKFEDLAKADKARYDEEMRHYVPPKGMGKKGRKKKDPNAPKRPPSAFFIFCSEHRPTVKSEYPNLTIGEIAKKLGEMWSKLGAKDRSPFEQKAVQLRGKYEKDVADYRAGGAAAKRAPGRPTGSTKKAQADPDDDDDDEDEEEDEDEDDDDDDDDE
ncbi:hypothetical protein NFI96_025037 [Prochilodus magdalenae]|nr:hypothetical protein NFI96_025037 [Prochilodus magdalenae]